MTPFLFVTDLDNTLVGDRAALETLNERLSRHRYDWGSKIVYATGRSLFLYRQLITEQPLLRPDALICSVGTAIYPDPQREAIDSKWAQVLSQGWDRDTIVAIGGTYSELSPQPPSEQGDFKVSYYLPQDVADKVIPQLESSLTEKGLEIQIVYSGGHDLDILPIQGNKGLAVQFLRKKWGFYRHNTVVCGDSGNDIALFSVEELRGIIVGNAMPELQQWYRDNSDRDLYFARSRCSGGILEGLQHFGFLT
ncbi:MAG: sucrose-phosphate phosphatase [Cyanobacteriota bacterium]|nr:sucrose-phosphate phosphatase [Cyanobacteriota bacterium]